MRNESITSDLRCMKITDPSPWYISPCDVNEIILLSTVLSIVEEQSSSSEARFPVDLEKFWSLFHLFIKKKKKKIRSETHQYYIMVHVWQTLHIYLT